MRSATSPEPKRSANLPSHLVSLLRTVALASTILVPLLCDAILGGANSSCGTSRRAGHRHSSGCCASENEFQPIFSRFRAASAAAIVLSGDVASIAAAALIAMRSLWFTAAGRHAAPAQIGADESTFDLMLAAELSPDQIEARPGNVLVPVRNPHLLGHVVAALQTAGDRDVVVMTARLLDVDVGEEGAGQTSQRRTNGGCSQMSSRWPSGSAVPCGYSSSPRAMSSMQSPVR